MLFVVVTNIIRYDCMIYSVSITFFGDLITIICDFGAFLWILKDVFENIITYISKLGHVFSIFTILCQQSAKYFRNRIVMVQWNIFRKAR